VTGRDTERAARARWLFALGVVCQLAIVAVVAYPMLGCSVLDLEPQGFCSDIDVTVTPGGCTDIEDELSSACDGSVWVGAEARWLSASSQNFEEFYVTGGKSSGSPLERTSLCTDPSVEEYESEPIPAEVTYLNPSADPNSLVPYGYTAFFLNVTIDTGQVCAPSGLCIRASIEQSPGDPYVQLSVDVDASGQDFEVLWTSDPVDGGIEPGQETSTNATALPTVDTTYTVTVRLTELNDVGEVVEVSDSVTALVGGDPGAPVANPDEYVMDEDGVLDVPAPGVLANDSDLDGDPLTAILLSNPTSGTLVFNEDGSFVYTPGVDFYGVDAFTYYSASDDSLSYSEPATVTIEVRGVNDPPNGSPDVYNTGRDQTLSVDPSLGVIANDTDPDSDPLVATLVGGSGPANGTLDVFGGDGSFTYIPNAGFTGLDQFSYTLSDLTSSVGSIEVSIYVDIANLPPVANAGPDVNVRVGAIAALDGSASDDPDAGPQPLTYRWTFVSPLPPGSALGDASLAGADTAMPSFQPDVIGTYVLALEVSDGESASVDFVSVFAGNTAPLSAPDVYAIDEDGGLVVPAPGVLANDSDPEGDALTASLEAGTGPANGELALAEDGSFVYTPDPDWNGTDSFSYTASDGDLDGAVAAVSITVNPVNDAPQPAPDAYVTDEDLSLDVTGAGGVLANDVDPDGDTLTVALVDDAANGALTLFSDGSFRYVPGANFNGSDAFSYTATDGPVTSAPVTVTLTVNPVADTPLALAGPDVAIRVSRLVTLDGSASHHPDGGAPALSFDWSFVPPLPAGSALTDADIAGASSAVATFTPDVEGSFVLELTVTDSASSGSDQVIVIAGNSAPLPLGDSYELDEDGILAVAAPGVLENDVDAEGDPVSASLASSPAFGALEFDADGSFTYTPSANFNGSDAFSYTASDGDLTGPPAIVTIIVRPVNDPPTASPDAYTTAEDEELVVAAVDGVLANDADPDSDLLAVELVGDAANGALALAEDGSFVYTPDPDWNGTDSFSYVASDGTVETGPTTVTLTVDPINDAPVASAGPDGVGIVGLEIPLDGSGSSDLEDDALTYTWSFVQVPPGSTPTLLDGTSQSARLVADTSGVFVVQLVVNDGELDSEPDTASFEVTFCSEQMVSWAVNASGDWDVGANWSTGAVPGPADDACIDVPADITVTHSLGTDSVRSLISNETFVLDGGSLELANASVAHQAFVLSGAGELRGPGTLTARGPFTWSGGTQLGPGTTVAQGGLSLEGMTVKWLAGRTLVNAAGRLATWSEGSIGFGEGGGIANAGTFRVAFDGTSFYTFSGERSVFANAGTLEKTAGVGRAELALVLNSTGVVRSSSGTLALTGGGTSSGAFEGAATLELAGVTSPAAIPHVLSGPISAANSAFTFGAIEVNGVYGASESTVVQNAVVNFNPASTVTGVGQLTIAGGEANFSSEGLVNASALAQSGGVLSGADIVEVAGPLTWSAGAQVGPGETRVFGGMTLDGSTKEIRGRTLLNAAGQLATWSDGAILFGEGGGIANEGTFRVVFDGASFYSFVGVRSMFANAGTLEKTAGAGRAELGLTLNSTGVVRADSGSLALTGGGTSSGAFEGAATLELAGVTSPAAIPHVLSGPISAANSAFTFGAIEVNGAYSVSESTVVQNAVVNFNPASTVTGVGQLTIAGGEANFSSGGLVGASALVQSGGVLSGTDTVEVAGALTWSAGAQVGPGDTQVLGGMSLDGTTKEIRGRTLVNAFGQLATWSDGAILFGEGGGIANEGTFRVAFDGTSFYSFVGERSLFENAGTLEKTAGGGRADLGLTLDNTGVVRADSGTLALTGGGTSSGAFEGAATLELAGATSPIAVPHLISGSISAASSAFTFGAIEVNGSYGASGGTRVENATVNFNPASTVTGVGQLEITAGEANFSSGALVSASAFVQSGGVLSGADTVEVAGALTWSAGAQAGPGETRVLGGMSLEGTTKTIDGRTIVNPAGQLATWSAGAITFGNGGGIANAGTFRITGDESSFYTFVGERSSFANTGTLEKTAGTGESLLGFATTNAGTLRASTGTIAFTGGYTQTAAGAIEIGISAAGAPGTAYGRVDVIGGAALDGTLAVNLLGGFSPSSGDAFDLLGYDTRSGAFATQSFPPLGGGLDWSAAYGANALTLSVGP